MEPRAGYIEVMGLFGGKAKRLEQGNLMVFADYMGQRELVATQRGLAEREFSLDDLRSIHETAVRQAMATVAATGRAFDEDAIWNDPQESQRWFAWFRDDYAHGRVFIRHMSSLGTNSKRCPCEACGGRGRMTGSGQVIREE